MSLAGCHSMVRGDHPLCLEVASEPPSRVRRLAQTIGIFGKQKDSPHGAIQTPRGGSFREVSIHAPAWGATRVPQEYRHWSGISIHAPAWGATDALLADFQESILFQSTHPRGVRPASPSTPPRANFCFNPRTHVGCDAQTKKSAKSGSCFNPRTHVGCDCPDYLSGKIR